VGEKALWQFFKLRAKLRDNEQPKAKNVARHALIVFGCSLFFFKQQSFPPVFRSRQ
jgi:hypothetical protein